MELYLDREISHVFHRYTPVLQEAISIGVVLAELISHHNHNLRRRVATCTSRFPGHSFITSIREGYFIFANSVIKSAFCSINLGKDSPVKMMVVFGGRLSMIARSSVMSILPLAK